MRVRARREQAGPSSASPRARSRCRARRRGSRSRRGSAARRAHRGTSAGGRQGGGSGGRVGGHRDRGVAESRRRPSRSVARVRYHFTFAPQGVAAAMTVAFLIKNWMLVLTFVAVRRDAAVAAGCSAGFRRCKDIGTLEATQLINAGNRVLLDVREPKEFDGRHAAERGPYPAVAARQPRRRAREATCAAGDRLLRSRPAQPRRRARRWPSWASRTIYQLQRRLQGVEGRRACQ